MTKASDPIVEQIRTLVAPLTVEERLAIIRTIAEMTPVGDEPKPSVVERRQALAAEQKAWYTLPLDKRQVYRGEFVAVQDGQVVDHDVDQRLLYIRIRRRFGHRPVLIVHADWDAPPVYEMRSPRLEQ